MSSWILAHLHPALRIMWEEMHTETGPASANDISELIASYPQTPNDYLDVIRQHQFISLESKKPFFTISFLSPQDILGWDEWCPWLQEELPGIFTFATDGDCCYFTGEYAGRNGVYKLQVSAPFWEDADYLAPSIRALLCEGVGWANKETPQ